MFLVPELKARANAQLKNLAIPPLNVPYASLSAPAVVIQYNCLIATAFLQPASSGTPSVLTSVPLGAPFFALLSPRALEYAAKAGIQILTNNVPLAGGSSASSHLGSAQYTYALRFGTPTLVQQGQDLNFTLPLSGSASATVNLFGTGNFGLRYNAYAKPDPRGTLQAGVDNEELWMTAVNLSPFVILLDPTGTVLRR